MSYLFEVRLIPAAPICACAVQQKWTGRTGAEKLLVGLLALTLVASAVACAQGSASWQDPSKHRVQFVTVQDGVRLEVLDWGGSGRPVVLLAGYNTAHLFDEFAVNLSETSRVFGITRRGIGASSRPDSGYTAQRSADDVLQVLDSLKLVAPVLVGQSWGGQDLNTLAAGHSERIAGLVYLNSVEDPTLVWADYGLGISSSQHEAVRKTLPAAMLSRPSPDYKSFQAYRDWQMRTHRFAFPESELRQLFTSNPDGTVGKYLVLKRVRDAIFESRQKPDYPRIRVPVLAFFTPPSSLKLQMQRYKPQDAEERAAMKQVYAVAQARRNRHIRDFQSGVPAARMIELPGANTYAWLSKSNKADVLRELRGFVEGLR